MSNQEQLCMRQKINATAAGSWMRAPNMDMQTGGLIYNAYYV
jgi:hypothetical protein